MLKFDDSTTQMMTAAVSELKVKTEALDALVDFANCEWEVDQDTGLIVFSRKDGTRVSAQVQIIGTYNTADKTWLWAWDSPSIDKTLCRDALSLKEYGQQHGIAPLATRKVRCEESDCWKLTALAAKLYESQGAYRGPSGPTHVFMTFSRITISS